MNWLGGGAPNCPREQDAMLVRWGYPYVFDTWFFHMTLTRRLSDAEKSIDPASRRGLVRAGVGGSPPGGGHLPVYPGDAGGGIHLGGTDAAARISAAMKRSAASAGVRSFTTVSTGT